MNGETFGAEEVAMQSNLSLVRDPLAREVWLATIMVRRPWRGRQTASRQRTLFDLENASEKRHQGEASKEVGVDTGSSRADSHNFLPVRRSRLSEPRSRCVSTEGRMVRMVHVAPGSVVRIPVRKCIIEGCLQKRLRDRVHYHRSRKAPMRASRCISCWNSRP